VDFSVSHSHAMVAVSWLADGRFRTGCDVQYVSPRRNHEAIAARFFAPSEQRYLARAETASDQRLRFCALWVLKESFLKLAGASIGDIDRTPCFALDDRLPSQSIVNGVAYTLYTCGAPAAPRYMLCVAREVADDTPAVVAPRLVWFSEARVAWAVGVGTRYAVPQRGGR
jgi:phosphopantetheinyl transferase